MPDYGEILLFLAKNPPAMPAERSLHASLLELLAACLRDEGDVSENMAHRAEETFEPANTLVAAVN